MVKLSEYEQCVLCVFANTCTTQLIINSDYIDLEPALV